MATLEEKIDVLTAMIVTLMRRPYESPPFIPVPTGVPKAYDLPPLTENSVGLLTDGSFNSDGSRWSVSKGWRDGTSNAIVGAGTLQRESYGYISPVKTPHIWAHARKILDAETFARWDADWQAHPYGVYRDDLETLLAAGKTEVNFMLFNYMTERFTEVVQ